MTDTPRCDYIPLWSGPERRCPNQALLRVIRRHGAGINPEYRERCLAHAIPELGPKVIAYRHPDDLVWTATD